MRVFRAWACTREIEKLRRKYPDIETHLGYFENLLRNEATIPATPIPGMKARRGDTDINIYKSRVAVPQLGGKRSGLRMVYEIVEADGERCCVCLTAYLHQANVKEDDVRRSAVERAQEYDATLHSLRMETFEFD